MQTGNATHFSQASTKYGMPRDEAHLTVCTWRRAVALLTDCEASLCKRRVTGIVKYTSEKGLAVCGGSSQSGCCLSTIATISDCRGGQEHTILRHLALGLKDYVQKESKRRFANRRYEHFRR
jgi:hypothetical protein